MSFLPKSQLRVVLPPGLLVSDSETSTQARERRRVALACRELSAHMTDIIDLKIEKVVGKVDELQRNLMHFGANMELVLSGMSLLLNRDCLLQNQSYVHAFGHGHSHRETSFARQNKSEGFQDLDSAGPQQFVFHDDPIEAGTPDINTPIAVAPRATECSSASWYGVDAVEDINQITFCAACPVISMDDDDRAEKVCFLETKLDLILADLDKDKGRCFGEVHNCSDCASQTISSSNHITEDDLSTSVASISDTGDMHETCIPDSISNTSKNDEACVTVEMLPDVEDIKKLNAVSVTDELRVMKEVHVAQEKLTIIIGERYRVLHLDDAYMKLEFLDDTMPNGASLTLSIKREDLVCFDRVCN